MQFLVDMSEDQLDNLDVFGYTIPLPGKAFDISAIVKANKFKNRGNKPGALEACKRLEETGMGKLVELGESRGTAMVIYYVHSRILINRNRQHNIGHSVLLCPFQKSQFVKLAQSLAKLGVTLRSYCTSLEQKEITR